MDFGAIGDSLWIIVAAIVLILLQFVLRRPRPEIMEREIVQSLLSEVRLDQILVETFHVRQKPKSFEIVSWLRNKTRLTFLSQSLQNSLSDAFGMAEDFNKQVSVAKKHKSVSYLAGINVDKMKESLDKSRQGLEEWLLAHGGTTDTTPKYPSLLDSLFGFKR